MERNVLNQVRVAPKIGQVVSVVCLERPGTLAPQVEALGAHVVCLNKPPGIRLGLIGRLTSVLRQFRPDIVHSHQLASLLYAGLAAQAARVPVVVHTEHGQENYSGRCRTRWLGRLGSRFASRFYCLTEAMAATVIAQRIVPRRKVRIIQNGIDTASYHGPLGETGARPWLGISDQAPVIGTVGRLTEIKRQCVLLRAFAKVRARFPAAHLLLVGDGPLREDLVQQANQLGLMECIHFVGYQARTKPYLNAMNVFALTSRSEGMPQAVLEAAVAGVPIVATRVGGLPEVIQDGRTGWLVQPEDDSALAGRICAYLADPLRARGMAEAARHHVEKRYSISRMAADYHRDYLALLEDQKRFPFRPGSVVEAYLGL